MFEKNHTLQDLLEKHSHQRNYSGWSGAEAYYLPDLAAFLKIAPVHGPSDLAREKEVLEWLEGKLAVPKVLGYESTGEKQCLLISEIKGIAASEYVAENRHNSGVIYSFIEKTAAAMREIHNLPIGNCSFAQNIDVKLAAARENIRRGFVDESDFEHENLGRKADDLYDELVKTKLSSEDLVFTHGDLCLPNFMIINGEISGFIDFDRGGVADRYQDIALFLRSFAFNIEIPVDITEVFCNAYGIDSLDHEKIRYYRLLDELF